MNEEKVFVPPIKIQGIKTKLVNIIKNNVKIESDTIWIEPFMGSGVVGFNLAPENAVFADLNPHIINFYNSIKYGKIDSYIARHFLENEGSKLSEIGDEYYYFVRNRFNEYKDPLDFLFLNRSCFNGMIRFNKDFKYNVPFCHKPQRFNKAYITKIINQISFVEQKIKMNNWSFKCQSFEKTIHEAPDDSFIYCDPPYIDRHVDYYDSWDVRNEKTLYELLMSSNNYFMLSTWDHNKYRVNEYLNSIWGGLNIINSEHFYFVGAKEKNRNPMIEALIMNYETISNENSLANAQLKIAL